MARQYTVEAGTWPLAVVYNILDLACINVYVLYKKKTGDSVSRKKFMFHLVAELRETHVHGKTIPQTLDLPSIFKNSFQSSMLGGNRKQKQCQINVNCKQNKSAKIFCGCCRLDNTEKR